MNILTRNSKEAKDSFLKGTSYSSIDFSLYMAFDDMLETIEKDINKAFAELYEQLK